jgi:hypothetical protein
MPVDVTDALRWTRDGTTLFLALTTAGGEAAPTLGPWL